MALTAWSLSRERILVTNKPGAEKAHYASTRDESRGDWGDRPLKPTSESVTRVNDSTRVSFFTE